MKALLVIVWGIIASALSIQGYFVYSHFFAPQNIVNLLGPGESINVSSVENKIVMGQMAGNRNLAFGVKNIMEEFLQEKDYVINPYAAKKIEIEIVYLDVLKIAYEVSCPFNDAFEFEYEEIKQHPQLQAFKTQKMTIFKNYSLVKIEDLLQARTTT